MRDADLDWFFSGLRGKKAHHPYIGQIELTYRCGLNCSHCYCQGSEDRARELKTSQWKKILEVIHQEGCLYLVFTGGDPLIRQDFLELYAYAKKKGFIITLFTNGQALTGEILNYLAKHPPYSIEITLNGITKDTYEAITQVEGSFPQIMKIIARLKKRNLPLVLKTNCLKQNKRELGKIKAFAEKGYFMYDPMIYPRLDGDKTPVQFRLSFEELLEVRKRDPEIWQEYQAGRCRDSVDFPRERKFLYRCNAWLTRFFINPYGRLKFCQFTEKYSVDLKTTSFQEGFYKVFPQVLNQQFKTNSKCRDCELRPGCYHCPARAQLETSNEEAPAPYYCELAGRN